MTESRDHLQIFRERLLLARRRKHWNQKELARRAGIDFTTISRIENGTAKQVYIHTVTQLARALEMTTDELLGMDVEDDERLATAGAR